MTLRELLNRIPTSCPITLELDTPLGKAKTRALAGVSGEDFFKTAEEYRVVWVIANELGNLQITVEKEKTLTKEAFIQSLGELLKAAVHGFERAEHVKPDPDIDDEYVRIYYEDGRCRVIDITADSYLSLIKDVVCRA